MLVQDTWIMWRLLYNLLLYAAAPVVWLRLAWRGVSHPEYADGWLERAGFIPRLPAKGPIWLHAVSAGEVMSASPLIAALREALPGVPVVLTTTTPAGAECAVRLFGSQVVHFYAPYDFPGAVRRFLNRLAPRVTILLERELWPNVIYQCHRRGIPVVLANARMTSRSERRYRWIAPLTRGMLERVSLAGCQSREQGRAMVGLGLAPERLLVTGNLKFDVALEREARIKAREIRRRWGNDRLVMLAASTHQGEEELMLAAYGELKPRFPKLLLVLAPRNPERFSYVSDLVGERYGFASHRRGDRVDRDVDVVLVDAMGELATIYGACDVAIVGGSFVPGIGGHNVIEPAQHGVPVITGPHYQNWEDVMTLFLEQRSMIVAQDPSSLRESLVELLSRSRERHALGERGLRVTETNRGATRMLLERIEVMVGDRSRHSATLE